MSAPLPYAMDFTAHPRSDGARHLVWRGRYPAPVARQYAEAWPQVRVRGRFLFGQARLVEDFVRAHHVTRMADDAVLFTAPDAFSLLSCVDGAERDRWSTDALRARLGLDRTNAAFRPWFALPDGRLLCFGLTYDRTGTYLGHPIVFDHRRPGDDAFERIAMPPSWPLGGTEPRDLFATDDPDVFVLAGSIETYADPTEFCPAGTLVRIDVRTHTSTRLPDGKPPARGLLPRLPGNHVELENAARWLAMKCSGGVVTACTAFPEGAVLWTRVARDVPVDRPTHEMVASTGALEAGWTAALDYFDPEYFDLNVFVAAPG